MDTSIRIKLAEPAPVLVDASGAETATLPGVRLGAVTHFALYIFDAAGAALDLSACAEFKLTLAKTYGGSGVMFRALAGFTRAASAADPVRADLYVDTELLRRYLGSQAQGRAILALNGYKPGSTLAELAVEVPVWLLARSDYDALPEDLETGAYNKAQVNVMINDLHTETAALDQRITDFEALREDAREFSEAAKTSEDNAKASEDAAKTSEDNAKASENAAKTSEDNAKASETNADTSKSAAAASAVAAENSRTAAGNSATSAAESAAEAKAAAEAIVDAYVYGIDYDTSIGSADSSCQQVVLVSGETYLNVDSFNQMPAHAWKRCVMDNLSARTVNYYLHPEDSTLKADGSIADLTGGDGDVMVEIGIVYRRNDHYTDDSGHEHIVFLVSDRQFPNSAPFRFFLVGDGETARVQYISAYKAALCDADGNPLTTDETAAAAAVYAAGHLLRSVAGAKPWANFTMANARTAAAANGGQVANAAFYEFLQLMMAIEYGTFNAQEAFSVGFSYASSGIYSFVRLTGRENFGNGSGEILADATQDAAITWSASATEATKIIQCSYRGIENPFGEFFDQADGFVANAAGYYSTTNTALYSTNYAATYSWTNHAWPASGMIQTFDVETLLPLTVGGSTTSYICDYFLAPTTISAQVIGRASTMAYSQSGGPGMISLYTTVGNSGAPYSARLAC